MSNFTQRLLTALIAGSLSIAVIVFSNYGLMLFCALISLLGVWEFMGMIGESRKYAVLAVLAGGAAWGLMLQEAISQQPQYIGMLCVGLLLLPIASILALFNKKEQNAAHSLGGIVLGMIYCFLPMALLYRSGYTVYPAQYTFALPLGILMLNWFLDSFAYLGGRWLGKHPLYPRISPKKTWEGSLFGIAACLILAGIFQYYEVGTAAGKFHWLIIAAIVSVFSQLGDLVESMFKRNAKVKDSGNLLPGHGGILDRFDGLYLSMPLIHVYLLLMHAA